MNKEQVKTLIKSVRTDLELFRASEQYYLLDRASKSLERLKTWKRQNELKSILESNDYKHNLFMETRFVWLMLCQFL